MGQALTNIVKNSVEAIEATEREGLTGKIGLSLARAENDHIQIVVTDDGVGLPIERERIMEPYMTTRARGTGLGLAIVRKIIEEHGGTLDFSDNPSGGTVVTLEFPTDFAFDARDDVPAESAARENMPRSLTRVGKR